MTQQQEVAAPARLGRSEALDGVRALAVLAVMARHAQVPFLPGGGSGVFVFFTLSGFLITTLLLQEGLSSGTVRLLRFSGRRLRRLAPTLLLVVLAVVVVGRVLPTVLPPTPSSQWLPAVLYVGNWVRADGGTLGLLDHTWSLAVEEQFYLAWPLTVLALAALWGRERLAESVLLASVLGAGLSLLARLVLFDEGAGVSRVYNGTDTEADLLLLGAAAAALVQIALRDGHRALLERACGLLLVPALLLLALVLLAQPLPARPEGTTLFFTVGLTALAGAAAVLVVHVVLRPQARASRLLALRPLPWLGRRSYALYLWHFPVFVGLGGAFGPRPGLVLAYGGALSLALAQLSHELVERPLHRPGSV